MALGLGALPIVSSELLTGQILNICAGGHPTLVASHSDPPSLVPSLFPFSRPQRLCTRNHMGPLRALTLTWRATLGGHSIILDLSDLLPGEPLPGNRQHSAPPFSLLPLYSRIISSRLQGHHHLSLTSALCLCFSSCWADFCLAFSTLLTGSLTLDFSLRAGGSMTWLPNAS